MLKFTNEDINFIKENFDNSDELLNSEKVNFVLDALYDLIDEKGFNGYDYNDFGRKAQKIYDNIFLNN